MICGCVEKQALVGTARVTSLGINCDPVHCCRKVQIEDFIESVTQSGTKNILTVANPFLTHSRSKVSYQSLLQKLFEKKYAWVAAVNP
jgi:hypothetical protein